MRVTAVVQCRDRGAFLLEGIASAEHAGAAEVVVADGGSTDSATLDVLSDVAALGYRVARGSSTGKAVNDAVTGSGGDAVFVLDATDRARPTLVAAADGLGADVAVYGDAEWFGERRGRDVPGPPDADRIRRGQGVPSTMLVDRAAWDRVGGFEEALPALWNWEVLLRLGATGALGYVPEVLSERRARRLDPNELAERRAAIDAVVAAHPECYRPFDDADRLRLHSDLATAGAWALALDLEAMARRDAGLNEVEREQLGSAADWLRTLAADAARSHVASRLTTPARRGGGR